MNIGLLLNEIGKIIDSKNIIEFIKYYSIHTDDKGRIYIQTNKTKGAEVEREIDLFSKDGYYLYEAFLPKQTQVIRKGYLYEAVKKDIWLVKRYKIKNWDQIRSGISN